MKKRTNPRNLTSSICVAALAGVLALAVATGCSSVKTNVDNGHISARAFSFLNSGRPLPDYAEAGKQAHTIIQQAITRNLAGKGVSQIPSGGDVTVAYLVVVGNNASTTSLNQYFGYRDDAPEIVDALHKEQTKSGQRGYFEAGTLVIDFLDPNTSKLLQRRSVQAEVLRNLTTEQRAARIQGLVDKALADVSISGR